MGLQESDTTETLDKNNVSATVLGSRWWRQGPYSQKSQQANRGYEQQTDVTPTKQGTCKVL